MKTKMTHFKGVGTVMKDAMERTQHLTEAEHVSKMIAGDGQLLLGPKRRWYTQDGRHLHDLATELGATMEQHPTKGYLTRYIFPDKSAIVVCRGAWDVEGTGPWTWKCLEEMAR